jgi:membrane-bound lytic murein transglycosylase D
LDRLQRLNKKFNGDWNLTLASYKVGEKRVHQEVVKNRLNNKPRDYWHLNLPKNTTVYIPQLLAYREILLRPQAYGLNLPVVTNTPQIMQVKVNKSIDLHKVARAAKLPVSTLVDLNLNFKNGMTNPHLSRQIVLPRRYATQLHQSIRLAPAATIFVYKSKGQSKHYGIKNINKAQNRLVNYHVRAGESLYKIALRHGTTVTNIMRLNSMSNTRIKTGENLRVALKSFTKKSV